MQRELLYRVYLVRYVGGREREKGEGEEGKGERQKLYLQRKGVGRGEIPLAWWKGEVGSGQDLSLKGTGCLHERPG